MFTPSDTQSISAQENPFLIEQSWTSRKPEDHIPTAQVVITPALRASGLLAALSDEAARTLLAILSFVTANGMIRPATVQLADVLGMSEQRARDRLLRLAGIVWREQPLARLTLHESGLETVSLSPALVRSEVRPPEEPVESQAVPLPSHREAIIAASRTNYARPREEVERMVLEQLGHAPEETEDSPEGEVWRRLNALGVTQEETRRLLDGYPLGEIQNQLNWLPQRGARNPARFVVAAVEGRYDPPPRVRLEQDIARLEGAEPEPIELLQPLEMPDTDTDAPEPLP